MSTSTKQPPDGEKAFQFALDINRQGFSLKSSGPLPSLKTVVRVFGVFASAISGAIAIEVIKAISG